MINPLTANQWKVLRHLADVTGTLISRSSDAWPDYDALTNAGCLIRFELDEIGARYDITAVGEARLREHELGGRGTI